MKPKTLREHFASLPESFWRDVEKEDEYEQKVLARLRRMREARARREEEKLRGADSNRRPPDHGSGALPD